MKETKKEEQKRKRSSRQIVAMAGVVLLVLLYVITLIAAIADGSQSAKWFRICLVATFALPLVIWIYSWMHARLTGKSAIGEPQAESPAETVSGPGAPQTPGSAQSSSKKSGGKAPD